MSRCAKGTKWYSNKSPWFARFTDVGHGRVQNALHYEGVVMRGIYVDQIQNFLCAGFRPEQMMVLLSSELFNDSMESLGRISRFVGRKPEFIDEQQRSSAEKGVHANHRARGKMLAKTQALLQRFYAPYNRRLVELLRSQAFVVRRDRMLESEFPTAVP